MGERKGAVPAEQSAAATVPAEEEEIPAASAAGCRIWIRADGNDRIASGHLRRCLSVAWALMERGARVTFLVADEVSSAMLAGMMLPSGAGREYGDGRNGMDRGELPPESAGKYTRGEDSADVMPSLVILHTSYDRPETEPEALVRLREKERPGFMLIDSYFMSGADFVRLRERLPGLPLGFIDDMADFDPMVELLINYSVRQPENYGQRTAHRLFGPRYAPLRDQFAAAGGHYTVREQVKHILLTTGGTDPYRMAERIIREIRREPAMKQVWIEAVLPEKVVEAVQTALSGDMARHVKLHCGVNDMAGLMASCDLAVSAGGTTLYELCAVGVPTAAFTMADNQQRFAGLLAETGAVELIGDVRDDAGSGGKIKEEKDRAIGSGYPAPGGLRVSGAAGEGEQADRVARKLVAWILRMMRDPAGRVSRSGAMRALTDGRGAERIAQEILSAATGRRPAAVTDSRAALTAPLSEGQGDSDAVAACGEDLSKLRIAPEAPRSAALP